MKNILEINNLELSFNKLKVLRGINLSIKPGEIHGILGESGSGKTVTAFSIMKLHDETAMYEGEIVYKSSSILEMSESELTMYRGNEVSYIFQNPHESLNPNQKIGKQLKETMTVHGLVPDIEEINDVLKSVGLDSSSAILHKYPYQLSGGECQRVMIAMSVLCEPSLIIADEPTSAIDATLKKQILELLKKINREKGTAIIVITHDLDLVKYFCDSVTLMYGGIVLEQGEVSKVIEEPVHPYSASLLKCTESLNDTTDKLYTLKGVPITPLDFKNSCPFYERCEFRTEYCLEKIPDVKNVDGRSIRCVMR